jgi:hypothetical protein
MSQASPRVGNRRWGWHIDRMAGASKTVTFEVVRSPDRGFDVLATRRNGSVERIPGFGTQQEAKNWIKYKSQGWLGKPLTQARQI